MLADSKVLLIRHAEKPPGKDKKGLSDYGRARAYGYAAYFPRLPVGRAEAAPPYDLLLAARRSKHSNRSRLTLRPLSKQLELDVKRPYKEEEYADLAHCLLAEDADFSGRNIIICWHHNSILALAEMLIGHAPSHPDWPIDWPPCVFGWLLWISYDEKGNATETRCYR